MNLIQLSQPIFAGQGLSHCPVPGFRMDEEALLIKEDFLSI
jgi:hypothetical protein